MTHSTVRTGCAVGVLCIASFVMVTSEFAPIGVLSLISTDLGRTPSDISLTVTLYAWIGAASGLLSHWLGRRVSRKALLIVLMLALAASNGLAALSGEFSILLGARILGALAHGVFWATVAATAAHLVSARRVGLATSVVMSGITIATVAGVPLINLVGQYEGWRTAFAGLSLLCLTSAAAMTMVLPAMPTQNQMGPAGFAQVWQRKDLLLTYAITGLTAAAHFAAYTFIEPFIGQVPDITPGQIATLLFAFGAAGFLGNLLSALVADRNLTLLILCALIAMAGALNTLGGYGPVSGLAAVASLLIVWGIAISALFTGLQTWVLKIAGPLTGPATAVHTAVLNTAIGIGVVVGSQALDTVGIRGTMMSASVVIIPAIVLMVTSQVSIRKKTAAT